MPKDDRPTYKSRGRPAEPQAPEPPNSEAGWVPQEPAGGEAAWSHPEILVEADLTDAERAVIDAEIDKVLDAAIQGKDPNEVMAKSPAKLPTVPGPRPIARFWFRGELVEVHTDNPNRVMLLCLLALQDPRVDAILQAIPFSIATTDGRVLWPLKPDSPAGEPS